MKRLLHRSSVVLCMLVLWELTARARILPVEYFPPFTRVLWALSRMLATQEIWAAEALTLSRALGGFLVAAFSGLLLAFATSSWPTVDRLLAPVIELLRPLPPAALIPLAIFFFGIGPALFFFVIAFGAVWPIYVSSSRALRSVDRALLDVGRSFGLSGWKAGLELKLPAALPEICTGLRLGAGVALIGTVVVEMLAGQGGIGFMLFDSAFSLRVPEMFALMIVAALNGVLFSGGLAALRDRAAPWHAAQARSIARDR